MTETRRTPNSGRPRKDTWVGNFTADPVKNPGVNTSSGGHGAASQHVRAQREKGLSVTKDQAVGHVNTALASGRAVRRAKTDSDRAQLHEEHELHMSKLQAIHPDLHRSVHAINHLQAQIEQGDHSPQTKEYLKQAKSNLRSRLNAGEQMRNQNDNRPRKQKVDTRTGPAKKRTLTSDPRES